MLDDARYEYSIHMCPTSQPEKLEMLLNKMSEDGWELYMLHEAESSSGGTQYNCIFYREYEEETELDNGEIVDVNDFKTRMERMLHPSNEPYEECKEIQNEIVRKQEDIARIKKLLDSTANNIDHKKLNEEISKNLKELNELKNELANIIDPDRMYDRINQDKLTIVISEELLYLVDNEKNGELITETVKLRQKLADEMGYVIPAIRFTNSEILEANEYRIDIRGIKAISGVVHPGYVRLYIGQSNLNRKPKDAIDDVDPITGERVFWLEESKTKNFWEKGLTPAQVISKNLEYIVCKYVDEVMDYKDVNHYIEIVGNQNLYLIENLIPESLSIGDLRYIFANLIREKISVKDLVYIFERLNDIVELTIEKESILEKLRISLGRKICSNIADINNNIYGIVISDDYAETLEGILIQENDKFYFSPHNPKVNKLVKKVSDTIKNSETDLSNMAIIAPPSIRPQIFDLFEQIIPGLTVISSYEIPNGFNLEVMENIT